MIVESGTRRREVARRVGACALFGAAMYSTSATATSRDVYYEAVDDYSQCHGPSLPNSVANAQGFQNNILAAPNSWALTNGGGWTNMDVWASDFYDPDVAPSADDTTWFDRSGLYAAYYAGHGVCPTGNGDPNYGTQCYHDSECNSPPAGFTNPGYCQRWPGDDYGRCNYSSHRYMALGTCSSPWYGLIDYSSGNVKWGETQYQGNPGWAGAGTNGGTNLAVIDSSCAEMSFRHGEILPAFAGMHTLATCLVHTGDTQNNPTRGGAFAAHYNANPNGSVADAWNDTLNSMPADNPWCRNRAKTQSYGGGMGYNGCGAQSITAVGANGTEAHNLVSESWWNLQWDGRDASGAGAWEQWYACNYDCYNWTFNLP